MKIHKKIPTKQLPIFLIILFSLLTGCAAVRSRFTQEIQIETSPKFSINEVDYFACKPQRAALRIGTISSGGNGFASFDDLIKKAKKQACQLGGDFIVAEDSGVNSSTVYSPGYSSYNANAYANYGTHSGYGSGSAQGYSVGPSITEVHRPWAYFSIWVYCPSQLGIRFDENCVISGFHLNSDASKAGLRVGDAILGIDEYDIADEQLIKHMMKIQPGNKVKITVQRKSKRTETLITALHNA